jgi:hypothetical protein
MQHEKTARSVSFILAVLAAAAILLILYKLSVFIGDLRRDVDSITASVNLLLSTGTATLAEARSASAQAALAAAEQRAYWNKTSLETYKTMAALRLSIVRTDHSVNDILVPRVSASLDASSDLQRTAAASITGTTARIDATIADLRPAIDAGIAATQSAAAAMDAAGKDLSDPAIHETLAHLDGVATNAEAASADVAAFIRRETTPVRGTWNVIRKFLQEFAGPAAQVATAAK